MVNKNKERVYKNCQVALFSDFFFQLWEFFLGFYILFKFRPYEGVASNLVPKVYICLTNPSVILASSPIIDRIIR
jgi:hypothetical protein